MRDKKKFYVPRKAKNPKVGDVVVKLRYGKEVIVSEKDFKHIKDFFKIKRFYGNSSNSVGNVKATSKNFGKQDNFSTENFDEIKTKFEIDEIIGAKNENNVQEGNIITHNSYLDQDIMFDFQDWLNLDSSYDLVGLYGINTYTEDTASNGDYVILANGHTLIIKPEDFSKVSDNWEQVDTIVKIDTNGHDYVDLGLPSETLWATMNVGASSMTDYGNYYMYGKGSTQYNSSDSVYSGTENPLATSADTAAQVWGGDWHMPTQTQLNELIDNTTYEWTTINGINGGKFIAQNGNYIFFPAAGRYDLGNLEYTGVYSFVWSSTPNAGYDAYSSFFSDNDFGIDFYSREGGYSIRPVIG